MSGAAPWSGRACASPQRPMRSPCNSGISPLSWNPMKRIEVKLSLPVVAPLLDIIKGLTADMNRAPVVESAPLDPDHELREAWASELIAGQSQDLAILLSLFGDDFF